MKKQKEIPKIDFKQKNTFGIEVMKISQLSKKLLDTHAHNPFETHKIDFFLILVLMSNRYTHFVDFKSHSLSKGSVLFVAQNQIHHFDEEILNAKGICIIFNNSFFDHGQFYSGGHKFYRLFNYHIENPTLQQSELGLDKLIDLANELWDEYQHPDSEVKYEILYSLLKAFLLKAERAKEFRSISAVKTKWMEIFSEFKRAVESQYPTTRSSKEYAKQLFISYKSLNEIVKRLTGKTAKSFIDDFVTIEIKRYLSSTSLSIKEISYKTGFEEPANLIKFFKKHTNTTPLQFRKQYIK